MGVRKRLAVTIGSIEWMPRYLPQIVKCELCRERLGASTWTASSLPPPIDATERAAYDAVARASAPRRALVPLMARGAGGAFNGEDRGRAGRSPRLGCRMRFGLNADQARGTSGDAQDAGPCFIRPLGAPTSEAGLRGSY